MKISKKAVLMWFLEFLMKPMNLLVLILFFLSGNLFLYLFPQNLSGLLKLVLVLDKWLFFGLLVALIFLVFSGLSRAWFKYLSVNYELEDGALKITRGAYKKEESYLPYKNIENIDIRISSGERLWGLASLLVFTAGAGDPRNPGGAEGYIPGLLYKDAAALKDELLKRINVCL